MSENVTGIATAVPKRHSKKGTVFMASRPVDQEDGFSDGWMLKEIDAILANSMF